MRSESNPPPTQQTEETRAREAKDEKPAERKQASADETQRFRELLQQRQEPAVDGHRASAAALIDAAHPLHKTVKLDETATQADTSAMLQAQRIAFDPIAANAAPAASPGAQATFAELLEKHVRRLLVSEGAGQTGRDGQVMLRLSDESLPGADLFLAKTQNGWTLRAETDRIDTLETIRRHAPALIERFSDRALGTLEIDAELRRDPHA